jgi:hypothetical protein
MLTLIKRLIFASTILLALGPITASADSALPPGAASSFRDLFYSHTQEMRKQADEAAAAARFTVRPLVLDFIPVPTTGSAVSNFLFWNTLALETSGRDHIFILKDPNDRCSGSLTYEQLGPHRSSRAMAIVHLAMFEAVNAVNQKYDGYVSVTVPDLTGLDKEKVLHTAIAYAARDTLRALYKNQADAWIEVKFQQNVLPESPASTAGKTIGESAAAAVLEKRKNDKANVGGLEGKPVPEPPLIKDDCNPSASPFQFKGSDATFWRQDPVSRLNVALGAAWPEVTPFVMNKGDQFRLPAINIADPKYKSQIDELRKLGGAGDAYGAKSATERTPTETMMGIFWAYDGVPSLCAPPTLYNQVARAILAEDSRREDIDFVSRLFAVINVAMADAGIAAWDSKFYHHVARPVTYIRDTDGAPTDGATCSGTGCTRVCTGSDGKWCPLGAPATNGKGPNFTPPFPAYPSGHATFGGALFRVLKAEFGDDRSFGFASDEFNGTNRPAGDFPPRPKRPRSWGALADAERENGRSRIWLGIHWQIDADAGIAQGHCVADWVLANSFRPKGAGNAPAPTCDYSMLQR